MSTRSCLRQPVLNPWRDRSQVPVLAPPLSDPTPSGNAPAPTPRSPRPPIVLHRLCGNSGPTQKKTQGTGLVTVSRPVGGVLSALERAWVAIHLSGLPGDCPSGRGGAGHPCPTLGLAPGGVYRADRVTPAAGALLPHRFTLACADRSPPSAVCSLWHFPAGHPDWPLASTLPCGAPTFLDPVPRHASPSRGHPAGSPSPPICASRTPVLVRTPAVARVGPDEARPGASRRAMLLPDGYRDAARPSPALRRGPGGGREGLPRNGRIWVRGEIQSIDQPPHRPLLHGPGRPRDPPGSGRPRFSR